MESLGGGRIVESRWSGGGEGKPERVGQRKMRWRASTGGCGERMADKRSLLEVGAGEEAV